jgi:hypothetical protein
MTSEDIYWVAGILEGEGCFSFDNKYGRKVTVNMTDEDIILRLQAATGLGRVYGPYNHSNGAHKVYYRWVVADRPSLARLLLAVYPLMGTRRQAKIATLVEAL